MRITILFLIFFISVSELFTQNIIELRDTSIIRGDLVPYTIYGNFENSVNSIEVTFRFNAFDLDIKNIEAGQGYIIQDSDIWQNQDLSDLENSKLTILSDNLNTSASILCIINLEGLVSADTITNITVESVRINGEVNQEISLDDANISLGNPTINPTLSEGIEEVYPNPLFQTGRLNFTINRESEVEFRLYNISGKKISEVPGELDDIFDYVITKDGSFYSDNLKDQNFQAGNYRLEFTPKSWQLAAGKYALVMNTRHGNYKTNFIYMK